MAKKNNKGFSLIEIVIAIAILTLLVTPIINQLAQTIKVNRRSKLQQYVNDSASKFMEEIKSTDFSALDTTYGATEKTITCEMVDESGSSIGSIDYKARKYDAGDVHMGPEKDLYSKVAYVDNLEYQIAGKEFSSKIYKVKHDATQTDLASFSGWNLADDGSIVQYNSEGFISKIICVEDTAATGTKDFGFSMGNMTDLDSNRVAIVPGLASNFDSESETKYYSMAMDYLKKKDPETWKQAMLHKGNDSILNNLDFVNSLKKLTKVYINETTVDSKKAYEVGVSVSYYSSASYFNDASVAMDPVVQYEPYFQVFKMDEVPAVYIEYQPYTVDVTDTAGGKIVTYAPDDYIMVENYVEGARVYLYKPVNDEMRVRSSKGDDSKLGRDGVSYYSASGRDDKVNIHISSGNISGSGTDNYDVYTNIDVNQFDFSISSAPAQFKNTDSKKSTSDAVKCAMKEMDSSKLHKIKDDGGRTAKFNTVRIQMENKDKDGYRVLLTGAKGDN